MVNIDDMDVINGVYPTQADLVSEAIKYYLSRTENKDITNFNEGSISRILMDCVGVDASRKYKLLGNILRNCFPQTAINEYLDNIGEFVSVYRRGEQPARGTVQFTPPYNYDPFVVPKGTKFVSREGYVYLSLDDLVFDTANRQETLSVDVESLHNGSIYNLIRGNTFSCGFKNNNIVNSLDFVGGLDVEADDDYRERIINYRNDYNLFTTAWFKKQTLMLNNVQDCLVRCVETEFNKDDKVYLRKCVEILIDSDDEAIINLVDYFYNKPGSPNRPVGTCVRVDSCEQIKLGFDDPNNYYNLAVYYSNNGSYDDSSSNYFSELKNLIYHELMVKFSALKIGMPLKANTFNDLFPKLGIDGYVVVKYRQRTCPTTHTKPDGDEWLREEWLGRINPSEGISSIQGVKPGIFRLPNQDAIYWINLDTGVRLPDWSSWNPNPAQDTDCP